jgi:N-methylhydantoinase A
MQAGSPAELDDISCEVAQHRLQMLAEEGGFVPTPVYDRELLAENFTLEGPALLEEPESTIVLPPGYRLALDSHANLLIEATRRQ